MRYALGIVWAVAMLAVPSAQAEPSFVVVKDINIGGFSLLRDANVKSAIEVFDQPATRDGGYDQCVLTWPSLGLTMRTFFTSGSDPGVLVNPCGPRGRHYSTTITDRRWRTSAGVRVGDSLARLRKLYKGEERTAPGEWTLLKRRFAGIGLPSLLAVVKNGRVNSIVVRGPRNYY